jgi:uncharacterized glyoxalase superfamily protein PhnB
MTVQPEQPQVPTNRSMPACTVIPGLAYANVREAVDWLCRVFGFSERLRIGDHRAQLVFGKGCVIVTAQPLDQGLKPSEKENRHSVMVRVDDIDRHYAWARQCSGRIVYPPTDYAYGERQYTAEDLQGRCWTFSQTIADVDPRAWGGILIEPT